MNLPDEIKTIDEIKELSTVITKSNFIAQIYPVFSENQTKEYLTKAKKKYYNASHHCYAFKLADGSFRYSDAGEPSGTAGIRILNTIDHFHLSDQLIIVSRIFGGVKLGVGPLGKAYYESAYNLINESEIKTKRLFQKALISTNYDHINLIQRILLIHHSIVTDSKYQDSIELHCLLKSSEIESISNKISEIGQSTINLKIREETVYK